MQSKILASASALVLGLFLSGCSGGGGSSHNGFSSGSSGTSTAASTSGTFVPAASTPAASTMPVPSTTPTPGIAITPAPTNGSPTVALGPNLATPRGLHTATLLQDGRVLIAGGMDTAQGGTLIVESEIYDVATNSFTKVSDPTLGGSTGGYMAIPDGQGNLVAIGRAFHTATLLQDGRVLICGGIGIETTAPNAQPTDMATAFLFDPVRNQFFQCGSLNTARSSHSAVLLASGSVVIAGGGNASLNGGQGGTLQSAEIFDPSTSTFAPLSSTGLDLVAPRQENASASTANGALLVGGADYMIAQGQTTVAGYLTPGAEAYSTANQTFANAPGPAIDRVHATLTATTVGFCLAGGEDSNGPVTQVESIDANLSAWSATATLQQARTHHAHAHDGVGTLLVGGTSLDPNGNLLTLASCELVLDASNTTAVLPLAHQRNSTAATRLMDGSILVTGGYENGATDPFGLDGTSVAASELVRIPGQVGPTPLPKPSYIPGISQSGTTTTTTTTTTTATNLPTVRVVAGNNAGYTDSNGYAWAASSGFNGGDGAKTSDTIAGTNDPGLYNHEKAGNMTWSTSLPDGTYDVTLKFAEFYWSQPGQRVFNVSIDGDYVLVGYDIIADAGGKDIAIDHTFTVTSAGGTLTIRFDSITDNAKISAIQVAPSATQTVYRPTIRVAAGNGSHAGYVDSNGDFWGPSQFFSGGQSGGTGDAISGTNDSQLYQHEMNGNMTFGLNVPNGDYYVTLKFAEFYWNQAGQRVFNVSLNGTSILQNYDVYADAGGKDIAVDHTFAITVTNGQISIQFTNVKDNAKISAIEITPR